MAGAHGLATDEKIVPFRIAVPQGCAHTKHANVVPDR